MGPAFGVGLQGRRAHAGSPVGAGMRLPCKVHAVALGAGVHAGGAAIRASLHVLTYNAALADADLCPSIRLMP